MDNNLQDKIRGSLIGVIHGYDTLPAHFKQNIELHDVILKMADDLFNGKTTR